MKPEDMRHRLDLIRDVLKTATREIRIHPALLRVVLGDVYAECGMPVFTEWYGIPVTVDAQCPGLMVR